MFPNSRAFDLFLVPSLVAFLFDACCGVMCILDVSKTMQEVNDSFPFLTDLPLHVGRVRMHSVNLELHKTILTEMWWMM